MTSDDHHGRRLIVLQLQHDSAKAAERASEPRQEPLPFGDGWLDEDEEKIEFHGSSVGLRLHAEADEQPCAACASWLAELIGAGVVRALPDNSLTADQMAQPHGTDGGRG